MQPLQRGQTLLEGGVERADGPCELVPHRRGAVSRLDTKESALQLDAGPVPHRAAVRDRGRLQHDAAHLPRAMGELAHEPRLPDAGLADHRHRTARARSDPLERGQEPLQVHLTAHERREPARGEGLGARLRGGSAGHLVHLDGRVQPPHRHRAQRARGDPAGGQRDGVAGGEGGPGGGRLLHPRGQVHGRPHRGVGHGEVVLDRAHHHLARVQPHADLKRHAHAPPHDIAEGADPLLHAEGGIAGADRMVLVGERRAEQRHDPVPHHLIHRPLVTVDGFHHLLEDLVEDAPRLLGIPIGEELHGPLHVGEEHGHLLALAGQPRPRVANARGEMRRGVHVRRAEARGVGRGHQGSPAGRAEAGAGLRRVAAAGTGGHAGTPTDI